MNLADAQHTSERGAGLATHARRLITRDPGLANHARRLPSFCSLGGLVVHGLPPGGLVHRPLGALDPCSRRVLRCAAAPIRDDRGAFHRRGHPVRNGGGRRLAHAVRRSRARCPRRGARTRSGGGTRRKGERFTGAIELPPRSRNGLKRRARAHWGVQGVLETGAYGGRREYADTCCEGNDYFSSPRRSLGGRVWLTTDFSAQTWRARNRCRPLVDRSRST
jgi:hypothetical protein